MKKICIIGGSGSGKTTLSNKLSKDLNIPVYHLDAFQYQENWQKRTDEERNKLINNILKEDKWIIDGNYKDTLKQRLEESDDIIFLDYKTITRLKGIIKRFIKEHNKERQEIPGCKEQLTIDFLLFVLKWQRKSRPKIIKILNGSDQNKIHIFKNRKELNKWYQKEVKGNKYEK